MTSKTKAQKTPVNDEAAEAARVAKDTRDKAIEAGIALACGNAVSERIKAQKNNGVATLDQYFGELAIKFASAKVTTTTDKRKAGEVPELDKQLGADECAMLARVGKMTDEELAAYGWKRETKMTKAGAATVIEGYKLASTWTQYKSNLRTAIINGTAKTFADAGSKAPPMARILELNREASKAAKLEEATKQHDFHTLASDVLARAVARLKAATSAPDKGEPDANVQRSRNMAALAVLHFAEDVNTILTARAMEPVELGSLPNVDSARHPGYTAKPMPVVTEAPAPIVDTDTVAPTKTGRKRRAA